MLNVEVNKLGRPMWKRLDMAYCSVGRFEQNLFFLTGIELYES